MFILLSTFIATFLALFNGLMIAIGALLGGAVFLVFLVSFLALGIDALIKGWFESNRRDFA